MIFRLCDLLYCSAFLFFYFNVPEMRWKFYVSVVGECNVKRMV